MPFVNWINTHLSTLIAFFCWLVIVLAIILMSFYYPGGRLSSDSHNYLQLAQNILAGNGRYIPDAMTFSGTHYFSQWPIGYSAVIASLVKITRANIFWASKIVNMLAALLLIILGLRLFKEAGVIFALFLLTAHPLNIFSMSWTEPVYILFLIIFSVALYQASQGKYEWLVIAALASFSAFLFRYAGMFTAIATLFLGVYFAFKKKLKKSFLFLITGVVQVGLFSAYYYLNWLHTGYILGRDHDRSIKSYYTVTKEMCLAILESINFISDKSINILGWLASLTVIITSWFLIKKYIYSDKSQADINVTTNRWKYFLLVALTQIAVFTYLLVFPRVANPRYLFAVLVFLFLAFLDFNFRNPARQKQLFYFFLVMATFSVGLNVFGKLWLNNWRHQGNNYSIAVTKKLEKYEDLENSLIAFADPVVWYYRPDLTTVYLSPESLHISTPEFKQIKNKMDYLLYRMCQTKIKNLYVDYDLTSRNLRVWLENNYNVKEFFIPHHAGELIKIEDCNRYK